MHREWIKAKHALRIDRATLEETEHAYDDILENPNLEYLKSQEEGEKLLLNATTNTFVFTYDIMHEICFAVFRKA